MTAAPGPEAAFATVTSDPAPTTSRRCSPRSASRRSTRWSTRPCRAAIRERDAARARRARCSEAEMLAELRGLAERNEVFTSLIGLGYHDTITPPVILRNVLENPAWYTAYTPYQPEISRAGSRRCSTSRRWCATSPGWISPNASLLDEGTAAAEAMAMLHRLNREGGRRCSSSTPTAIRRRSTSCARAPSRSASTSWSAIRTPTCRLDGVLRRARAVPGEQRPAARPRAGRSSARTRSGALVACRGRPARAHAGDAAGRDGRRRRRRHDATVRRAARLRRSARRVPRDARRVPAHAAGPARRRVGRRAGSHRVPARAADARAAHPAREGDEQHLHRAGAARGDRRAVRVVPRRRGAAGDRATRAPARRRRSPARCAPAASRSCTTHFFDTLTVRVPGPRRRGRAPRRDRGASTCARSTPTRSASRSTRRRRPTIVDVGVRRVRRRRRAGDDADATDAIPAALRAHVASSSRIRRSRAPLRAPDAAVPAPARRPRPRARPHDDPARFVHDEAERDRGDGADHVARVRAHPSVRAARPGAGLPRSCSTTSSAGWPRSPATTRSRCSRTRVRRASTRACSRSASTTRHAATPGATCASSPRRRTAPTRRRRAMAGMRVVVVACDDQRQRRPRRPEGEGRRALRPARAR